MEKENKTTQKIKNEDYVFKEENPAWLNTPSPFDNLDNEWMDIIIFFVFHVPVLNVSARAKPLAFYNWGQKSRTDDLKQLKRRLIKYGNMSKESFLCKESWAEIKQAFIDNDLYENFPCNVCKERVAYRKCQSGENDSLLLHIRNSFAHGRLAFFDINEKIYIAMEDIDNRNHVSARMILSKTTLLCWKTIISSGPYVTDEEYEKLFKLNYGENITI